MNKKTKEKPPPPAKISLPLALSGIYYSMLVGIIVLISYYDQPLSRGDWVAQPTFWLYLLMVFYYVLPVIIAALYGVVRPPFWRHFRDLLVIFGVIHGLYSVTIYFHRYHYLNKVQASVYEAKKGHIKTLGSQNEFKDVDQDGIVDEVKIIYHFDMENYLPGRYKVYATLTQQGEVFPDSYIGEEFFNLKDWEQETFTVYFRFNPQIFAPYFESGDFEINVGLERILELDQSAHRILLMNRWSPFLRSVSWRGGQDPEVTQKNVELEYLPQAGTVAVLPLQFQKLQVVFWGFQKDFGRDTNGDGLFDEMVVVLKCDSKYEGPVFIQALIEEAPYPLIYQTSMTLGTQELEYVVPARLLHRFGLPGPYTLTDFRFYNRNPECQEGECRQKLKPFFTIYLQNYLTQRYNLNQFYN